MKRNKDRASSASPMDEGEGLPLLVLWMNGNLASMSFDHIGGTIGQQSLSNVVLCEHQVATLIEHLHEEASAHSWTNLMDKLLTPAH
jgi:hypothetical protein